MTLVFVRHGETALNAARTLQPFDTPLSTRGHAQAAAAAQRLKSFGLAGILSSDQPRALQTADAIAGVTGLSVQTTPLLQERNFGDLRGQPYDNLSFDPLAMAEAPANGESMAEFAARVAEAFAFARRCQARLGGPLAVVTHGLVVRGLFAGHVSYAPGAGEGMRIGNTALTIVEVAPPHRVTLFNCTRHLDGGEVAEDRASLSGG